MFAGVCVEVWVLLCLQVCVCVEVWVLLCLQVCVLLCLQVCRGVGPGVFVVGA